MRFSDSAADAGLLTRVSTASSSVRRLSIASLTLQRHRTLVAALWFVIALRPGNTLWLVGIIFGWLVLAPLLLVAVCTLPRGLSRWHEFWQFYEMHYQISLRFLAPVYIFVGSLGLVSTAVLLFRQ